MGNSTSNAKRILLEKAQEKKFGIDAQKLLIEWHGKYKKEKLEEIVNADDRERRNALDYALDYAKKIRGGNRDLKRFIILLFACGARPPEPEETFSSNDDDIDEWVNKAVSAFWSTKKPWPWPGFQEDCWEEATEYGSRNLKQEQEERDEAVMSRIEKEIEKNGYRF